MTDPLTEFGVPEFRHTIQMACNTRSGGVRRAGVGIPTHFESKKGTKDYTLGKPLEGPGATPHFKARLFVTEGGPLEK